jgi:hypothetical protein
VSLGVHPKTPTARSNNGVAASSEFATRTPTIFYRSSGFIKGPTIPRFNPRPGLPRPLYSRVEPIPTFSNLRNLIKT